jgi:hypothetical protein
MLGERPRIEGVVHPATLPPSRDQACFPQHLEVEGEPRLSRAERTGEFADASLARAQPLQNPEAGLVGEGVGGPGQAPPLAAAQAEHGENISTIVDCSQVVAQTERGAHLCRARGRKADRWSPSRFGGRNAWWRQDGVVVRKDRLVAGPPGGRKERQVED